MDVMQYYVRFLKLLAMLVYLPGEVENALHTCYTIAYIVRRFYVYEVVFSVLFPVKQRVTLRTLIVCIKRYHLPALGHEVLRQLHISRIRCFGGLRRIIINNPDSHI